MLLYYATEEMALEPLTDVLCECNGGRTTNSEVPRPTSRHQPELGPNPNNFSRLCSWDETERAEALEEMTQSVISRLSWTDPVLLVSINTLSCSCCGSPGPAPYRRSADCTGARC